MGTGGAVISSPLSKVHPIENALYQYKYIMPIIVDFFKQNRQDFMY